VALWFDGRWTNFGATPKQQQVGALVAWLNTRLRDGIFHSDCLPLWYPPAEEFADLASGVLALSVSHGLGDYVLWFRPEVLKTVTWAGNPNKSETDAGVLSPRSSFAAWRQSVQLHSTPWTAAEQEAARQLRVALLEVVLLRINQVAREREVAQQRQNELMRELDQRLKEWRTLAAELKRETERRAVAESELSEVLRRTVTDQEAERLRIARELHDTLGQSMTLLKLGLDGIARTPGLPDSLHERLEMLKTLASNAGREINRLAWEIRPTALDDLGLQTAIRSLVETWSERTSIRFELHLALDGARLAPAVETTLYRVLQEALTNVVRHAGASRVAIILTLAGGDVTMIVEDNGRGMPEGQAGAAGASARRLGLLGMRERVSMIDGVLELESAPGKGTTLFVKVAV
jgi:signal transduction histidine kinase